MSTDIKLKEALRQPEEDCYGVIEKGLTKAYHSGYYDGLRRGIDNTMQALADKLYEEFKVFANPGEPYIYIPIGEWLTTNDYSLEMEGDGAPMRFRITPVINNGGPRR